MGWLQLYDHMDDSEHLEMLQAMLCRCALPSVRLQPRHVALPAVLAQSALFMLLRNPLAFAVSNLILVAIFISPALHPPHPSAHWVT